MILARWVLCALAVWRITHLLSAEDGPFDLVVRLRRLAGAGFFGKLLDCFYCLSVWVAAPFAWVFADELRDRLLLWPALSGAAILLEKATSKKDDGSLPLYYEEPERTDVLRQPAGAGPESGDDSETGPVPAEAAAPEGAPAEGASPGAAGSSSG